MIIDVLSLFPEYFESPLRVSILKRAQKKRLLSIHLIDRKVDDRPYGGGPGMVLMPGPVTQAIRSCKREDSHVIYLTPQGTPLNAQTCERLAHYPHLVLVCGHYEGIDERVIDEEVDEEVSIGDYVLTNGCIAALVLIDGVARFIPGVLGAAEGVWQDSFQEGILEAPLYTRPPIFEGKKVPEVLLSGNHKEIAEWQKAQALQRTRRKRPDLYCAQCKS
jgi:tRNA (guanine37-N1)-methyltransferase